MRRPDWVMRLRETVEEARTKRFAYGDHDCCLFASRCIDAMTGRNTEQELATQYTDEASALRFIRKSHGIDRAVTERLGEPCEKLPRRGDVALVRVEDGKGVGVCVGAKIAVASDTGLAFYPIGEAILTWRIN